MKTGYVAILVSLGILLGYVIGYQSAHDDAAFWRAAVQITHEAISAGTAKEAP